MAASVSELLRVQTSDARPEFFFQIQPLGEVVIDASRPLPDTNSLIIPDTISFDQFNGLSGGHQQAALVFLLERGNVGKIDELKPHFKARISPTRDEAAISFLARLMFKRGKPITLSGIADDDVFAQIYALASPDDKTVLVEKLEHERIRATEEFADEVSDVLFAPEAYYGGISPERRYFANIWEQVERQKMQASGVRNNTYTRDSFKPKISDYADLRNLSERDKRMMDGIDKYERSHGSYWT